MSMTQLSITFPALSKHLSPICFNPRLLPPLFSSFSSSRTSLNIKMSWETSLSLTHTAFGVSRTRRSRKTQICHSSGTPQGVSLGLFVFNPVHIQSLWKIRDWSKASFGVNYSKWWHKHLSIICLGEKLFEFDGVLKDQWFQPIVGFHWNKIQFKWQLQFCRYVHIDHFCTVSPSGWCGWGPVWVVSMHKHNPSPNNQPWRWRGSKHCWLKVLFSGNPCRPQRIRAFSPSLGAPYYAAHSDI